MKTMMMRETLMWRWKQRSLQWQYLWIWWLCRCANLENSTSLIASKCFTINCFRQHHFSSSHFAVCKVVKRQQRERRELSVWSTSSDGQEMTRSSLCVKMVSVKSVAQTVLWPRQDQNSNYSSVIKRAEKLSDFGVSMSASYFTELLIKQNGLNNCN